MLLNYLILIITNLMNFLGNLYDLSQCFAKNVYIVTQHKKSREDSRLFC